MSNAIVAEAFLKVTQWGLARVLGRVRRSRTAAETGS
jgi:hypothetical protein